MARPVGTHLLCQSGADCLSAGGRPGWLPLVDHTATTDRLAANKVQGRCRGTPRGTVTRACPHDYAGSAQHRAEVLYRTKKQGMFAKFTMYAICRNAVQVVGTSQRLNT